MSFIAVGVGVAAASSIAGGIIGSRAAQKEKERADRQAKKAKEELDKQMQAYRDLDTSNPYLNMENVMEDLTINQKQAEFQAQQFAQSQANIMEGLRGAAGSSGIAGLAQALAQQGQLASQRSAASIGQQESANQRAERAMAGQIQSLERKGDLLSRQMQKEKTTTLLGMAQQDRAAALQRQAQARQAKTAAITGAIQGVGSAAMMGAKLGVFGGGVGGGASSDSISDIVIPEGGGGRFLEAPAQTNVYNPLLPLNTGGGGTVGTVDVPINPFSNYLSQPFVTQSGNIIDG
jgi:hypothetical protein